MAIGFGSGPSASRGTTHSDCVHANSNQPRPHRSPNSSAPSAAASPCICALQNAASRRSTAETCARCFICRIFEAADSATPLQSAQSKAKYDDDFPKALKAHSHCVPPLHLHASHSPRRVRAIWPARGECRAICVGNVIRKSLRRASIHLRYQHRFFLCSGAGNWPLEISNMTGHDCWTDHVFL